MSSEMKRRVLMTIAGVCICGLSIGMFSFSNLGLDPFQVFAHGTWHLTHMGFGTFYALMNIVLLVLIFFVNRRKIGLGTVINLFGVGYMAEFSEWVIRHFVHTEAFGVRFLFLCPHGGIWRPLPVPGSGHRGYVPVLRHLFHGRSWGFNL